MSFIPKSQCLKGDSHFSLELVCGHRFLVVLFLGIFWLLLLKYSSQVRSLVYICMVMSSYFFSFFWEKDSYQFLDLWMILYDQCCYVVLSSVQTTVSNETRSTTFSHLLPVTLFAVCSICTFPASDSIYNLLKIFLKFVVNIILYLADTCAGM